MSTDAPPRTPMPDEPFYRGAQSRRWGGLLLLLGLVWLVFELTSRSAIFAFALVEEEASTLPQSFSATHLVVRGGDDQISLHDEDGDQVTVTAVRHGFGWNSSSARSALQRVDLHITQQGETLSVEVRHNGGVPFLFGRSPYADVQIGVPEGMNLDVQTISGDLAGEGIRSTGILQTVSGQLTLVDVAGDLQLRTTSGDLQLRDAGPGLKIETISGDVRIEGGSGALRVESISGDLDLRDLREALLDLDTTSGDIEVVGVFSGQIHTTSGDVDLRFSPSANLKLSVTTMSGAIEYDLQLREVQQDWRSLQAVVGAGQAQLQVSTASGDVELRSDS
ncbi:DUF4097 family beta strand repeat-containing protein [Candidatus Oscillochloris fontis]|uniref:DUF4097 family beta strand repeat-containing protein n=1 Tax=Candidatus Oscillochloris fontis TaxID=2496868 RepID=UPI00101BE13F|nr:DUF4097 family beta strand repeat-containing protein [Candidatus Oscillochloris fontis]